MAKLSISTRVAQGVFSVSQSLSVVSPEVARWHLSSATGSAFPGVARVQPFCGYGRRTRSSSRLVTGSDDRERPVTVVDVAAAAPGTWVPSVVHVWPLGEVSIV